MKSESHDDPVELPIDGVLDLHAFRPAEVADLVRAYLHECRTLGVLRGRIIHGKGSGVLRNVVHMTLEKIPFVAGFRLGDETSGSWGATLFELKEDEPPSPSTPR